MAHPYKESRVTKLDNDRAPIGRKVPKALLADKENDEHKLKQRQKQIDFGKNTIGYQNFTKKYPNKNERPPEAPSTPNKNQKCSKRSWDGQIKIWRKKLHEYDDSKQKGSSELNDDEDEEIVIDEEEEAERILQEHKNENEIENQPKAKEEAPKVERREAKSIYDDFDEDEDVEICK